MPKVVRIGIVVAWIQAALGVVAVATGEPALIPLCVLMVVAAIGIQRGNASTAFGYALFQGAQVAVSAIVVSRAAGGLAAAQVASIGIALAVGILFVAVGLSLDGRDGVTRGMLPWLLASGCLVGSFACFEPFAIPTGAMEDTILIGDKILVQLFPRPSVQRFDIVVIRYPIDHRQTFVKRVVGLPGDRLKLVNKQLVLNGKALTEPYALHKLEYLDSYRDNFPSDPNTPLFPPAVEMLDKNVANGEVVVPQGKYFVLGDNRDQSLDSRYWGFVSEVELIGKPVLVYGSRDRSTDDLVSGTLSFGRVRWSRIFKRL